MKKKFKFFRSERGATMAELAIVIPTLVVFIGAIYEISRAYYIQQCVEYATKEAGKTGTHFKVATSTTTLNCSDIQTLIENSSKVPGILDQTSQFMIKYYTKSGTELSCPTLPFDRTNNPTGSVDLVEVTITYPGTGHSPVPAVFDLADAFGGGTITIMGRTVFQIDG